MNAPRRDSTHSLTSNAVFARGGRSEGGVTARVDSHSLTPGSLGAWLLSLAVHLLRAPAVRRRLLPLLFPGGYTDGHGRFRREPWALPVPVLGDQCVPGCDDPMVDWDGGHFCRVTVGRVEDLPVTHRGDAHGAVVEVTQFQGEARHVWLLPLDVDGNCDGDGVRLTPPAATALGELLDTAFVLAGHVPTRPVDRHSPGAGPVTAPCAPWCGADEEDLEIDGADHCCVQVVGSTSGEDDERLGVDLVQRVDPKTGVVDRQIGVVDEASGSGVSFTLERLDELLSLIDSARRQLTSEEASQ